MSGDLDVLRRLLRDLYADLTSSRDTVGRHGATVQQLHTAIEILSEGQSAQLTQDQFVDHLGKAFERLRELEDGLTSAAETIERHAAKLQHLDLAMQLLTEVVIGIALQGGAHPVTTARLQNLRACCRQALTAN